MLYEVITGRSKEEIARNYGIAPEKIIKLGSNENPWGCSPKIKENLILEVSKLHQYPEPVNPELMDEISKFTNVPKENLIVGGDGADEVIDNIMRILINEGVITSYNIHYTKLYEPSSVATANPIPSTRAKSSMRGRTTSASTSRAAARTRASSPASPKPRSARSSAGGSPSMANPGKTSA